MYPQTQYAETPDGVVAYQVFGDGPLDLVFVTQWGTNIDLYWDEPSAVRYLDRLGSFARVIMFDKRGTGISDPIPQSGAPPFDRWMEDIQAVMKAAGSKRAAIVGDAEGGVMAIVFAATFPEQTHSLVLINSLARVFGGPDYPIGLSEAELKRATEIYQDQHGTTGNVLNYTAPSVAEDPRFRQWWLRFQRSTMPPSLVKTQYAWQQQVDVTSVLPTINVPTMVIHRRDNFYHRVEFGRWIADRIPGAKWVELAGADSLPFHVGNFSEILDHVEEFVTGTSTALASDRRLATVLFTDVVGSTTMASVLGDERWLDLLNEFNRVCRLQIVRFGGSPVKTTGDGFVALFDAPAKGISAAKELTESVRSIGVDVRTGLHSGEITIGEEDIGGIGVHLASRVMGQAADGGIAVSRTVKDLTVGSSIEYRSMGSFTLKGIPDEWELYEVL